MKFKNERTHPQRRVRTQVLNPRHRGSKGVLRAREIAFSREESSVGYPVPNGQPRKKNNTNTVMWAEKVMFTY